MSFYTLSCMLTRQQSGEFCQFKVETLRSLIGSYTTMYYGRVLIDLI